MLKEKFLFSLLRHSGLPNKTLLHIQYVTVCSYWSLISVWMLYSSGDKPEKKFQYIFLKFLRTWACKAEGFAHKEISRKPFCQQKNFFISLYLAVSLSFLSLELWRPTEHLLLRLIKQKDWNSFGRKPLKNQEVVANTTIIYFSPRCTKNKLYFLKDKLSSHNFS